MALIVGADGYSEPQSKGIIPGRQILAPSQVSRVPKGVHHAIALDGDTVQTVALCGRTVRNVFRDAPFRPTGNMITVCDECRELAVE